jgi:hypothetical protein
MNEDDQRHMKSLIRHIDNVRQSCYILGEIMIQGGEDRFGLDLIANGQIHDCSKFRGAEWQHLRPELIESKKDLFEVAKDQHIKTNPHHPEYWGSIQNMPKIYLAEMVCDWHARSHEQANDLRGWIKDSATKKFNMSVQSKVYKDIKVFVDMLLDPKFK